MGRDRADSVREQLLVTLGLSPLPPKTPLKPWVYGKLERDGYSIEKVVLETLPGFTLSGNLYRPRGKSGQFPIVLCPHGHWEDGRVNPEVQQRCIQWAKLGAVVFLYDMVGYNDSKSFGHAFLNDRLRRWGLSLVTLQTWNSVRALDWLTSLPDVDPARWAVPASRVVARKRSCSPRSTTASRWLLPSSWSPDSFQGGCVCENAAGLRIGTDNVEFAALTAPRSPQTRQRIGRLDQAHADSRLSGDPRTSIPWSGRPTGSTPKSSIFPANYNQTTRNAVYAFMATLAARDPGPEAHLRRSSDAREAGGSLDVHMTSIPPPPIVKRPSSSRRTWSER